MAQTTTKTIVAVYSDPTAADRAVQELVNTGFNRADIEVRSGSSFASDAAQGNTGLWSEGPDTRGAGGGIGRFFRNLFGADVRDEEGERYADFMRRGGTALIVHTDADRVGQAQDILERYNPEDLDRGGGSSIGRSEDIDTERTIPVAEEEIHVGKRAVERGGVRVYSRVIEQPVDEDVTLREEHVRVERRPVNREASEADFARAEQVIEVTETVEEPVIGKRARVREEVVVGKETTTRKEKVRDSVRKTDVSVEHVGEGTHTDYDADFEKDFRTRYGSVGGATFETYAPAYRYGSRYATDSRYRGKSWDEVHETIRTDYMRDNPKSNWEQMKDAVRYGWDKVTGKR